MANMTPDPSGLIKVQPCPLIFHFCLLYLKLADTPYETS